MWPIGDRLDQPFEVTTTVAEPGQAKFGPSLEAENRATHSPALVDLAKQRFRSKSDVVKSDIVKVATAVDLANRLHIDPRKSHVNDENRNPELPARLRSSSRKQKAVIRVTREARPTLEAVYQPTVN